VNVHVLPVEWAERASDLRAVREQVFIEEQGVPRDEEWDGLDEAARHFIAIDAAGRVLGTARLLPSGQIGRMAVLAEERGRGLGRRLLDAAVAAAQDAGHERVFLHAQTHAVPFYRKAGFDLEGEPFNEAGIPHRHMVKLLPIAFATPGATPLPPPAARDEREPDAPPGRLTTFADEAPCRQALAAVLESAERSIAILSPALEARLLATPACVETLSRFARRAAVPHVRILVADPRAIADSGNRLLALARRLPSKFSLRRLPDEMPEAQWHSVVIVDDRGFWVQAAADAWDGFANPNDRVEARRLREDFDRLFDRSRDDPELRSLPM
jgi:predicted GNAT family N-acyltransferase